MRLLLAEDEKSLSRAVTVLLRKSNYEVDSVYDGEEALAYLSSGNYDGAILDIMMPKVDGIEVLRQLRGRGSRLPVLLLTAKAEVDDKVLGLDSGANDYLTKPFASQELLARIRAMTREQTAQTTSQLHVGNVTLDRATFELSTPSGSLRLANKEFQMLELLMCNPRNLISTERFLEKIWGYDNEAEINVVWVYISYLRKKLAALHSNVQIKARRTLRTRLVAAAMLSLLVVLTVILGVILLGSYRGIVSDADRILDLLAEGEGTFPTLPADFNWEEEGPRRRSPELGYEIRYFSVLLDESGNVATTDLGQIAAVDQETAEAYAQQVRAQGHTRGFLQDYRYLTAQEGDQTRVIFLDYSGYLFTFRSTLFTGLWVSAVGLLAVFLLLLLLSRRIIRPILESYEKQKRFITDAGHELKTPIAIIQADTDVLTLETGEGNEWIDDIQHQVRRLSTLTNDLIYLSRMEEPQRQTAFLPLPFSDLVAETAQSFQAVAKSQGKTFSLRIQPTLTLVGEEKSLGQLVSILLDNALKYSPPGGEITVTLARQGKSLLLTVANTAQTLSKELLENMFDRFYRGDKARSSEQGGYGIGLSIAKAVVQSHKGKISAAARGDQLVMTVVLPAG